MRAPDRLVQATLAAALLATAAPASAGRSLVGLTDILVRGVWVGSSGRGRRPHFLAGPNKMRVLGVAFFSRRPITLVPSSPLFHNTHIRTYTLSLSLPLSLSKDPPDAAKLASFEAILGLPPLANATAALKAKLDAKLCPFSETGTAAANDPPPTAYLSGGSGIAGGNWKVYVLTPPAEGLCGKGKGKAVVPRLASLTVSLANDLSGAAIATTVTAGLFELDSAAEPPTGPPVATSPAVPVTVPFCVSPCTPALPDPTGSKAVATLPLATPAWALTPGKPFGLGLSSAWAGNVTDVKWASVVAASGSEAPVAGASGFAVAPAGWVGPLAGPWAPTPETNANLMTLEYECVCE